MELTYYEHGIERTASADLLENFFNFIWAFNFFSNKVRKRKTCLHFRRRRCYFVEHGASSWSQLEEGFTVSVPLRHQRWLLEWFLQYQKGKHILQKIKDFDVEKDPMIQREQNRNRKSL
jgi:hypothetical protein